MLKILYTYILRMTTGYKPPKAGASRSISNVFLYCCTTVAEKY